MNELGEIIEYSKKLKLLYVEDNQDSREMTSMVLEDFFDDIVIAVNGEDGLEKFKNNKIDIIITDINMPKLNGLEMIEKIKEIDSDVPILVLSAHNEDDFFIRSIRLGVDGYLLKPIDLEQLLNMLKKIIKRYRYINDAKIKNHLLAEYKKAVDQSAIISKTDKRGIIKFVNERFCEVTGYSKDEVLGKNHNIIRDPETPKELYEKLWYTIKDKKETWRGIMKNRTKDDKPYYIESTIVPILDMEGNVLEYIAFGHDITKFVSE